RAEPARASARSIDAPALAAQPIVDLDVVPAQTLVASNDGMGGLGERTGARRALAAGDQRTCEHEVELGMPAWGNGAGGQFPRPLEERDDLCWPVFQLDLAEHE